MRYMNLERVTRISSTDIGEDIYNYEGFYEKFTYQICWDLGLTSSPSF